MLKANRAQMKEINKNMLRQILREQKKATKPELSALTELSVVTVNTLISEMLSSGEVIEGNEIPSNGGRPSRQYIYNGNYKKAILIYGHENNNQDLFHILIINLFGECIYHKKSYYSNIAIDSFDQCIKAAFKAYENICTIIFALPGEEQNGVIYVHDYPSIIGDKFLSYYKEKYQVPVLYENDINAAVCGFYARENTEAIQTVAGIYYPRTYGPGAGVVINGEIYRGFKNFAGEISWLPQSPCWKEVDYNNPKELIVMLSQIAVTYSCVLAPERIIFYGDFFTEEILENTILTSEKLLQGKFLPHIQFEKNLEKDLERGIIQIALRELERNGGVSKWC